MTAGDPDVHLSVFLHGARFDFAARSSAAHLFRAEWNAVHCAEAVTILPGPPGDMPRLPCERLYCS
ncbi:hypothetical protein [Nocardia sp. X0981]